MTTISRAAFSTESMQNLLNVNYLHARPLSSICSRAVEQKRITMLKDLERRRDLLPEEAYALRGLIHTGTGIALVSIALLAAVEAVAGGVFTLLAASTAELFQFICGQRFVKLNQFTAHCASYVFNNIFNIALNGYFVIKNKRLSHSLEIIFKDHASYAAAAFLGQLTVTSLQAVIARKQQIDSTGFSAIDPRAEGSLNAFVALIQCVTPFLRELRNDLLDPGLHSSPPHAIVERITRNLTEDDLSFLRTLSLPQLLLHRNGPDTVRTATIIGRVLQEFNVQVRGVDHPNEGVSLDLHQLSNPESAYRQALANYVKPAYRKMTNENDRSLENRTYADYLRDGIEDLQTCAPGSMIPLAYFVQIEELSHPICCPDRFGARALEGCNTRKADLVAAKANWERLSPHDRKALRQRLVQGADFPADALQIENRALFNISYNQVTTLASALYQGSLMTESRLGTNGHETTSLFQRGWLEAVEEGS